MFGLIIIPWRSCIAFFPFIYINLNCHITVIAYIPFSFPWYSSYPVKNPKTIIFILSKCTWLVFNLSQLSEKFWVKTISNHQINNFWFWICSVWANFCYVLWKVAKIWRYHLITMEMIEKCQMLTIQALLRRKKKKYST